SGPALGEGAAAHPDRAVRGAAGRRRPPGVLGGADLADRGARLGRVGGRRGTEGHRDARPPLLRARLRPQPDVVVLLRGGGRSARMYRPVPYSACRWGGAWPPTATCAGTCSSRCTGGRSWSPPTPGTSRRTGYAPRPRRSTCAWPSPAPASASPSAARPTPT